VGRVKLFDYSAWVEEGLAVVDESAVDEALPQVRDAWDAASLARAAYKRCDYETADREMRRSMALAGSALLMKRGFRPLLPEDPDLAKRACVEQWGDIAEAIYKKSGRLRRMRPLVPPLTKRRDTFARRSVYACGELCALVECTLFISPLSCI